MLNLIYQFVVNFIGKIMKLTTLLRAFGLSDKESALYLATLELGSGSVQKIARKAGLVRSTAYEVLEQLRNKGLVTTLLKKRVRYYSAEDPHHLIGWTESKMQLLKDALPELLALSGHARMRPGVRFYEGKDGIRTILKEILNEADSILAFGSAEDLFRELEDFQRFFVTERIRRKIPIRIIHRDSPKARERQRLGSAQLREIRIIPASYRYYGLIYIWKNKIALFSFKNDFEAVVVESAELSDMQKAFFGCLWDRVLS